jgi:hypothetical protein
MEDQLPVLCPCALRTTYSLNECFVCGGPLVILIHRGIELSTATGTFATAWSCCSQLHAEAFGKWIQAQCSPDGKLSAELIKWVEGAAKHSH